VLVEIIVIKTLVTPGLPKTINMTLTPVYPIGPTPLFPNDPVPFKLPPGFWNETDPHDFPWYKEFELNYTTDLLDHFIWIDIPDPSPDSFFDVFFTWGEEMIVNYSHISVFDANPWNVPFDPDGSWPLGIYNITIRQSTVNSTIEGLIWDAPYVHDGYDFDHPHHHEYGELLPQDSIQHRTTGDRWYTTYPSDASSFEYFLTVFPEYEGIADWNMELYVATDPTAPIRWTTGDYTTGEWPRTLSVPTILDPDWSPDGFILRVIYEGEYAFGELQHVEDRLAGTDWEKPLWHTMYGTDYYGVPIPYPDTGVLFINCSIIATDSIRFDLNATSVGMAVTLWVDGVMVNSFVDNGDGSYTQWLSAVVGTMVTITIDSGGAAGTVLFLWSDST
jgi:hypothetical protein